MKTRIAAFTTAIVLAILPAAAQAHEGIHHEAGDEVPHSVERSLGGEVTLTDSGLYRIDMDRGPDLFSHGADTPAEVNADSGASAAFGSGAPERAPLCTLERDPDERFHVIEYARPASANDRYEASKEIIRSEMRRTNWALNRDSLASGGPTADYRVGCNFPLSDQEMWVGNFTTPGSSFDDIVSAARASNHTDPRADYTVFYDGEDPSGKACGFGSIHNDDRLTADNANVAGSTLAPKPDFAVIYRSCWQSATAMHEMGHNEGAVQYSAPHSTGTGWHCWDEQDVMCYSPDGGNLHQQGTESLCTDREYFDCNFDDYFDSNPEPGEYLATHWNLGSPLNTYLAFGAADGDAPNASFTYGCSDTACRFNDTSTDDDAVVERSWAPFWANPRAFQAPHTEPNPAITFPGPGTYPVTLRVRDARRQWRSATQAVTVTEGVTRLTSAMPTPGTTGARDAFKRYSIRVPAKTRRLRVTLDGPDCIATPCDPELDLYAKRTTDPTRLSFKSRASAPGADESLTLRKPAKGTWRIGVDNVRANPGTAYTLTAKVIG